MMQVCESFLYVSYVYIYYSLHFLCKDMANPSFVVSILLVLWVLLVILNLFIILILLCLMSYCVGDHPPITPVGLALPHELTTSDNQRIYELVCRHFLATLSPDAVFQCTKAKFATTGGVEAYFTVRGKRELMPGFLQVYRTCVSLRGQSSVDEEEGNGEDGDGGEYEEGGYGLAELPELQKGSAYRIAAVKSRTGATRAPGE